LAGGRAPEGAAACKWHARKSAGLRGKGQQSKSPWDASAASNPTAIRCGSWQQVLRHLTKVNDGGLASPAQKAYVKYDTVRTQPKYTWRGEAWAAAAGGGGLRNIRGRRGSGVDAQQTRMQAEARRPGKRFAAAPRSWALAAHRDVGHEEARKRHERQHDQAEHDGAVRRVAAGERTDLADGLLGAPRGGGGASAGGWGGGWGENTTALGTRRRRGNPF
jgi:hypothetical protein